MNVHLIHATEDAEDLLIFTKNTRLNMSSGIGPIREWTRDMKAAELSYMAKTIPSSWEFVHLTFLVEGLSRAAAQQVTRTRTASYAMQSQRVSDVRDSAVVSPPFKAEHQARAWDAATSQAMLAYSLLVDDGMPAQDARGILPMNVECNLVVQYSLRSFADMLKARKSVRAQGEYAEMALRMEELTIERWPWSAPFFVASQQVAIGILEGVVKTLGVTTGKGPGWEIGKAIDLLRKG